jgi:hypothetical protein
MTTASERGTAGLSSRGEAPATLPTAGQASRATPARLAQSTHFARLSKPAVLAALVFAAALAGGCGQGNYTSPERYDRGLVVCLSGAGGMVGECDRMRDGLASGGVDRAIEVFDWSRGDVLSDQVSVESNRRMAGTLARRLESYMIEHPGRPVHLLGISAGTGLIVWALENLQEGFKVDGAIILASSLDTRYDLTQALMKVKGRMYSFNSVADTILSLGVTMTGTVDRHGTLAGGFVGFGVPDGATEETKTLYREKLTQIGWWPGDVVLGHMGDHLGASSATFVRVRIAPIVLGKEPAKVEGEGATKAAKGGATPAPSAGAARGGRSEKPRFYGWMVRRNAAADADSSSTSAGQAAGATLPAGQKLRSPAAPEKIDESAFFAETGRLP